MVVVLVVTVIVELVVAVALLEGKHEVVVTVGDGGDSHSDDGGCLAV